MLANKIENDTFKVLTGLGLNEKEIIVYLTCLELGPTVVNDIAKKSGIKRVTVYVYLETLKQKGFVSETKRGNKRLFIAEDAQSLKLVLDRKKYELESIEGALPNLIKKLDKVQAKADEKYGKTKIRYYEGVEGVLRVYDEIFQNYTEICTWTSIKNIYKWLPQGVLDEQVSIFKEKGTNIKEILEESKEAKEYAKNKNKPEITKILPKKYKFPMYTDFLIFGKSIAMISGGKKLVAVVIDDAEMAKTQKNIFDIMWDVIN